MFLRVADSLCPPSLPLQLLVLDTHGSNSSPSDPVWLIFAVCSFTKVELTKLQTAPVRTTLARLGINRNTSRDIVFGSSLYGGLGLLHLFVEQGIAQLQLLTRHPFVPKHCRVT
jgi:hypothetical protein